MITPRPYISWSQLSLFESSPERYKEVYIYDKKIPINRGMAYGKQLADGLEKGELTGNEVMDMTMIQIPKLDEMEKEVRAIITDGKNTIELLARMDTAKKDLSAFKEYKTGQGAWTQKKVDEFGQITFYATAIWLKTKKIPQDIELVWIETAMQLEGKIEATGAIKRFVTKRTAIDCLKMCARIKRAWAGIRQLTEKELL
jgi:hypothetical protein